MADNFDFLLVGQASAKICLSDCYLLFQELPPSSAEENIEFSEVTSIFFSNAFCFEKERALLIADPVVKETPP